MKNRLVLETYINYFILRNHQNIILLLHPRISGYPIPEVSVMNQMDVEYRNTLMVKDNEYLREHFKNKVLHKQ